jgi:hypothetical protein
MDLAGSFFAFRSGCGKNKAKTVPFSVRMNRKEGCRLFFWHGACFFEVEKARVFCAEAFKPLPGSEASRKKRARA